jgi:beta-carotene 3-hydroxylase
LQYQVGCASCWDCKINCIGLQQLALELLYGFAYFIVHEVIIHQRIKWFSRSNNRYIKAIRWAHKMHHKHLNKEEGESFGMLIVAKKYWDKIRKDEMLRKLN